MVSVKTYHAGTSDANLPQTWYPEGPGSPVTIEAEYYSTFFEPYEVKVAYFLSGNNAYFGSWMPEHKYTRH
ncbi:MAG: hypothetical protein ACM3ME_09575 [Chloroflexota bacterium]|nr:hypothetical protein [Lentimicrobium sp.]